MKASGLDKDGNPKCCGAAAEAAVQTETSGVTITDLKAAPLTVST